MRSRQFSTAIFKHLRDRDRVFIHGAAATPQKLLGDFISHVKNNEIQDISTYHLHLTGPGPIPDEESMKYIRPNCLFTGGNLRRSVNAGNADYIPVFLYEIPSLFRNQIIPLDVALIQVSPFDKHGYCSLGTSVDVTLAAIESAKYVIGQVNANVPRVLGDGILHQSKFDEVIYHDEPISQLAPHTLTEEEQVIGKLVAENLVEDGATLQMGIGSIPDAVLSCLNDHKDLGIHTEMFSDGVLPLFEKGVITNKLKKKHHAKTISSFLFGSQALYDFVSDNAAVNLLDVAYVNDPYVISQQHKMTAINSCVEIDLTGQVVSDSIGHKIYSGFGGQVDFIRGASMCPGGKPIIALTSRTKKGKSKIVSTLTSGAGVVTTRAHVHYVVTEYGIANLFGMPLRERAKQLINISHPDDRDTLYEEAHRLNLI